MRMSFFSNIHCIYIYIYDVNVVIAPLQDIGIQDSQVPTLETHV